MLLGNLQVQVLFSLILTQNLPFLFLSLYLGMTRLLICPSLPLHHLTVLISDVVSQSKLIGCHDADVLLGIFNFCKEAKDMKFANLWFDCGDVFYGKRTKTRTRTRVYFCTDIWVWHCQVEQRKKSETNCENICHHIFFKPLYDLLTIS